MPHSSKYFPIIIAALLMAFCLVGAGAALAATESSIKTDLKKEEEKAKARQASLKRLTDQEKELDKTLATAEKDILALEKKLAEHRKKLSNLASEGEATQKKYEQLLAEQKKTELAMREMLYTFWGIYTRRVSVGGRDLENWPALDREYYWTSDLMRAIELYRERLSAQEAELGVVIGERDAIGRDIAAQMAVIDQEKAKLLNDRIKYEQRLAGIRKDRQGAQAELNATLRLIEDLNFDLKNIKQASLSIDKSKGQLPWPTKGRIAQKYSTKGANPVRGVGFATSDGADVRSVHAGKVMFRDTMRGLGLVVVVQHGQDYFSVYAFLSDSSVSLGQTLNRGQVIGRSGYYPAINGNGLYFELRHHQNALNPEVWLAKS